MFVWYETSKIFLMKRIESYGNWAIIECYVIFCSNIAVNFDSKFCDLIEILCEIIVAQVNFISLNSIDFLNRVIFHTPINCYCMYPAPYGRFDYTWRKGTTLFKTMRYSLYRKIRLGRRQCVSQISIYTRDFEGFCSLIKQL